MLWLYFFPILSLLFFFCSRYRDVSLTRESKGRYTREVLLPKFAQFAPGPCSQILNRLNIVSILRGGNSAPEDEVYPWNRWYTRRSFAPGKCPWSMLREQNPSCVPVFNSLSDYRRVSLLPLEPRLFLYCPHSTTLSFRLQFLSFIDHFLLMDPVRGSFVMASVFLQSYWAALAGWQSVLVQFSQYVRDFLFLHAGISVFSFYMPILSDAI